MTTGVSSKGRRVIDAERVARVTAARKRWSDSLMGSSQSRNPLLAFRPLKVSTLNLDPDLLVPLLHGKTVSVSNLFALDEQPQALHSLRAIAKQAATNRDDRAIETLFLALSMATWQAETGKNPPHAPVVLLPITIELLPRGTDARLSRRGSLRVNMALLHVLETRFGCDVTRLREWDESDVVDVAEAAETIVALLEDVAQDIPGFTIEPASVLGNFSFQHLQLVRELEQHSNELMHHDVVAALAGSLGAVETIHDRNDTITRPALADSADWQRFLIRDADSSQVHVIASALAGQSGVVQGPPGTGKSQVIANTIAVLVAHGKRVLFVAEKRAALDVVKERLQSVDLGHLLLDFHDPRLTRKAIAEQIRHAIEAIDQHQVLRSSLIEHPYQQSHAGLVRHVDVLHAPRQPSERSVYDLIGHLLHTPPVFQTVKTRWRNPDLATFALARVSEVETQLIEAGGFGDLFLGRDPSPWTWAQLRSGEEVDHAWDAVEELASTLLPRLIDAAHRAAATGAFPSPQTIDQILLLISILPRIARTLERYDPTLFDEDLDRLARALSPAGAASLQAVWAFIVDSTVREAYGAGRRYYHAGRFIWPWDLERDLVQAAKRQTLWQSAQGETISVPSREQVLQAHALLERADPEAVLATSEDLVRSFHPSALTRRLGNTDPALVPLSLLMGFVSQLQGDRVTPDRLPRMLTVRAALDRAKVTPLIREFAKEQIAPSLWPGMFEYAWIRSCFDEAVRAEPHIRGFNGRAHTTLVERFADLDVQRIAQAPHEVQTAHATRARTVLAKERQQALVLRKEANKKSRHLSLRQMVEAAPEALTAVCPCWLGSPLSVGQFTLPKQLFDVVIFDEASQVVPEVAIASLLRGASVLIAGDRNQLPPTTFFAGGLSDESSTNEPDEQFESLLEAAATFLPTWSLDWHYRSQDESLISFANHQIYEGRLVTFPDAGAHEPTVQHVLASSYDDEVARVVTLIADHLTHRSNESLGVIAFGQGHATTLEKAVAVMLEERTDLEPFFDESRPDRVFIRNLERVQGDERDAVILSVGHAKRPDGVLELKFGPLNQTGGERRLNVAITRARQRMTIVSAFTAADMAHGRSDARGVGMLRDFLSYAARAGVRVTSEQNRTSLDAFEKDVFEKLKGLGLPIVAHYGQSAVPLTFALRHPKKPNRFVLAIECDGPAYRDTLTTRDRERLRSEQLKRRGWHYHRIWSLDWFTDWKAEAKRVAQAYIQAIQSH